MSTWKTRNTTILSAVTLCLWLLAGDAYAQKTLRMKFVKGATSTISLVNRTSVQTKFGENENKAGLVTEMDLQQTVQEVREDGSAVVEQKLARIKLQSDGGALGVALRFDSAQPEQSDQQSLLSQVLRPLIGAEFKVTFSNRGEVLDVEPPADLVKTLQTTSTTVYQQMFSKESFKSMLSQSSVVLPEEPVSVGEKWQTKFSSGAQVGGAEVTVSYRYGGTVTINGKDLEKLDVTMVVKLVDSKLPDAPRLSIKKQSNSGTMYFDNLAGMMNHSVLKQDLEIEGQIGAKALLQRTIADVTTTIKQ